MSSIRIPLRMRRADSEFRAQLGDALPSGRLKLPLQPPLIYFYPAIAQEHHPKAGRMVFLRCPKRCKGPFRASRT
jgi:hypothetical protein